MMSLTSLVLVLLVYSAHGLPTGTYEVSDAEGLGRRFDGIGGLSGGGATSKLLVGYPEPQRNQILDYLFKPNFGASVQILKVEIGGDDQSVSGTEASHMHSESDINFNRGYEWWLMKEAKKRNGNILFSGLPWAWPGWLGGENGNPYSNITRTAMYIVKWIQGAKEYHNLTIDSIGIWNEVKADMDYVMELRNQLDKNNLGNVKIIVDDGFVWGLEELMYNTSVSNASEAIYSYGIHYPGIKIPQDVIDSNVTLWDTEDYATNSDDNGASCLARILNQNYAVGYMTSTIICHVISSVYKGLPSSNHGLMNADEPWSGHYDVQDPIWVTAHTTQFTDIGDHYLLHGQGVGTLKYGGSYVSLTNSNTGKLSIIIETMSSNHTWCFGKRLPYMEVTRQKAFFKFGGKFAGISNMQVWRTTLNFTDPSRDIVFQKEGPIKITDDLLEVELHVNSIYTFTTLDVGMKGGHGQPPPSKPFPLPYLENFENYQIDEEPYYLSPQYGVWEIQQESNGNHYARQTIQDMPISFCYNFMGKGPVMPTNVSLVNVTIPFDIRNSTRAVAIIGDRTWTDIAVSVRIRIPSKNGTDGVFVAVHSPSGGCGENYENSTFFWISTNSRQYTVTLDLAGNHIIDSGFLNKAILRDKWHQITVNVKGHIFEAKVDDVLVAKVKLEKWKSKGYVALGTGAWGYADYDDLKIDHISTNSARKLQGVCILFIGLFILYKSF